MQVHTLTIYPCNYGQHALNCSLQDVLADIIITMANQTNPKNNSRGKILYLILMYYDYHHVISFLAYIYITVIFPVPYATEQANMCPHQNKTDLIPV